ncbi:OB-fold domain-containing protein [Brevundimonas diminuta]|uniref:Zn-ribbon domain-containing OB-fold protein n=1 Tax=Brevundimonas diminuta TaxID=293 RepID=UPI00320ACF58
MTGSPTSSRAIVAGPARAWRTRHSRYGLVASHCSACDDTAFPPARRCVSCGSRDLAERRLAGRGEIVVLAEDHSPLVGHGGRSTRPFAIVALEEGVSVMAEIIDAEYDFLAPGVPVELIVRKWRPEQTGLPLYGFKFRVAA